MLHETTEEAERQARICNACRYCEGYCDVFPQLQSAPTLDEVELVRLANICHNCRGCYYACQYTAPHEFDLNFPKALAQLRNQSWQEFSYPRGLAGWIQNAGFAPMAVMIFVITLLFLGVFHAPAPVSQFYDVMSHAIMVAIFLPLFLLPIFMLVYGLYRYWRYLGGNVSVAKLLSSIRSAMTLKNLSGGEAHGCNFEKRNQFSGARKWAHHLMFYGFLLCFLATSLGTIWHYALDYPAPYPLWSAPKLSGLIGGVFMVIGGLWMMALKHQSDPELSDPKTHTSEYAFILLLVIVAASGLALNGFGASDALRFWLAFHLASVATLFILTPYSKMAHGFYRLIAMMKISA